ncbi:hypothetical protein SAMN05216266_13327 [Amycolatopsis marina]|uniref:Uncharacterized protein n=1 Tax=Amycolatopsis marina TaxID=490629 RepID=A0A1I1CKD5_9PSEU|nr:hypothetical protein [Amycolatopsis marina]SFB63121.1 hypothetical protein SAMN05216266_13327 [Amycolatopsis marina]
MGVVALGSQEGQGHVDALDLADPTFGPGANTAVEQVGFEFVEPEKHLESTCSIGQRNACVRCPLLRVDPAQIPRVEEIHANLVDRLEEAKQQGWLGEVPAIETTMATAVRKLEAMRAMTTTEMSIHLGMPAFRSALGRFSPRN